MFVQNTRFERIILDVKGHFSLHHLSPFLFSYETPVHGFNNQVFVVLHLLTDENQVLSSVSDVPFQALLLKRLLLQRAHPRPSNIYVAVDRGLRPLEKQIGSVGQPNETFGSEQVLENAFLLLLFS